MKFVKKNFGKEFLNSNIFKIVIYLLIILIEGADREIWKKSQKINISFEKKKNFKNLCFFWDNCLYIMPKFRNIVNLFLELYKILSLNFKWYEFKITSLKVFLFYNKLKFYRI